VAVREVPYVGRLAGIAHEVVTAVIGMAWQGPTGDTAFGARLELVHNRRGGLQRCPMLWVRDLGILALLAHIDRDRYTILAVDLTVDGPASATVYAFDRAEHGTSLHAEIIELGRSRGEVPVVPFDVPAPNVEDFIRIQKDLGPGCDTDPPRPGPRRRRASFTPSTLSHRTPNCLGSSSRPS
jgi:hypothetical protein